MIRDVETALGDLLRQITESAADGGTPVDPSAFLEVVGCLTQRYVLKGFGFDGRLVQDAADFLGALLEILMKRPGLDDDASTEIRRLFGGTIGQRVCVGPGLPVAEGLILISV